MRAKDASSESDGRIGACEQLPVIRHTGHRPVIGPGRCRGRIHMVREGLDGCDLHASNALASVGYGSRSILLRLSAAATTDYVFVPTCSPSARLSTVAASARLSRSGTNPKIRPVHIAARAATNSRPSATGCSSRANRLRSELVDVVRRATQNMHACHGPGDVDFTSRSPPDWGSWSRSTPSNNLFISESVPSMAQVSYGTILKIPHFSPAAN